MKCELGWGPVLINLQNKKGRDRKRETEEEKETISKISIKNNRNDVGGIHQCPNM